MPAEPFSRSRSPRCAGPTQVGRWTEAQAGPQDRVERIREVERVEGVEVPDDDGCFTGQGCVGVIVLLLVLWLLWELLT